MKVLRTVVDLSDFLRLFVNFGVSESFEVSKSFEFEESVPFIFGGNLFGVGALGLLVAATFPCRPQRWIDKKH